MILTCFTALISPVSRLRHSYTFPNRPSPGTQQDIEGQMDLTHFPSSSLHSFFLPPLLPPFTLPSLHSSLPPSLPPLFPPFLHPSHSPSFLPRCHLKFVCLRLLSLAISCREECCCSVTRPITFSRYNLLSWL